MLPDPSTPNGYGQDVREDDIARAELNRKLHADFYDSWSDESPAALSQRYSEDIRRFIRDSEVH